MCDSLTEDDNAQWLAINRRQFAAESPPKSPPNDFLLIPSLVPAVGGVGVSAGAFSLGCFCELHCNRSYFATAFRYN